MITGTAHAITPSLNQSLSDFSSRLNNKTGTGTEIGAKDKVIENNDKARELVVGASAINNRQNVVDTYVDASQTSDDENNTAVFNPDPADIYNASIKYSRRKELIYVVEKAGEIKTSGLAIDIMI